MTTVRPPPHAATRSSASPCAAAPQPCSHACVCFDARWRVRAVSPISDTTLLSALATRCPAPDHVLTQAPYALFCALLSVLLGTLPHSALGVPAAVCLLLSFAVTVACLRLLGRRSDDSSRAGDGADDDGIPLSGPCRSITPCTALSEAVPGISTGIIQGIL